jgi:hypothetical protein
MANSYKRMCDFRKFCRENKHEPRTTSFYRQRLSRVCLCDGTTAAVASKTFGQHTVCAAGAGWHITAQRESIPQYLPAFSEPDHSDSQRHDYDGRGTINKKWLGPAA